MKKRERPHAGSIDAARGEIEFYRTEDGESRIEARLEGETGWLSQKQMAGLFQTSVPNVSMHLRNIFKERELSPAAVVKEFLTTATDGKSYAVAYYNLDAIISVGYRVNSPRGTQFRQWATERLREYVVKGFVLNDERLKNPPGPGVPDYFSEMLERIRDIRSSERRMYLRVREILALAADYDPKDEDTQVFFQTVQNKLHFTATGMTAPELIAARADASKANMGLTSWQGTVVRRHDITVAKNYLEVNEISELNRIDVPGLRRGSSETPQAGLHARLAGKARRIPRIQRTRGPRKRRQGHPGGGGPDCRHRVREVRKSSPRDSGGCGGGRADEATREESRKAHEEGHTMNSQACSISSRLSLRKPQIDSLEILAWLCETLSLAFRT